MLVDANGLVFKDDKIQKGEKGGEEAAHELLCNLNSHCHQNYPVQFPVPQVVVRMYANVRSLGETLQRAGVVHTISVLEDFVRGFNGAHPLVDFVDAGTRGSAVHDKVAGMSECLPSHDLHTHYKQKHLNSTFDNNTANGYSSVVPPLS